MMELFHVAETKKCNSLINLEPCASVSFTDGALQMLSIK